MGGGSRAGLRARMLLESWGQQGHLDNSGSHVDPARIGKDFQKGYISTVTHGSSLLFKETCPLYQAQCPRM